MVSILLVAALSVNSGIKVDLSKVGKSFSKGSKDKKSQPESSGAPESKSDSAPAKSAPKSGGGIDREVLRGEIEQMRDLANRYTHSNVFDNDVDKGIGLYSDLDKTKAFVQTIMDKYRNAKFPPRDRDKQQLEGRVNSLLMAIEQFEQQLGGVQNVLPSRLEARLKRQDQAVDEAIAKTNTNFLQNNGEEMANIGKGIDLLEKVAADNPKTAALRASYTKTQAKFDKARAAIIKKALATNRVPKDAYRGKDRAQMLKLVREKWAKEGNGRKMLRSGLNAKSWSRKTEMRRDSLGGYYKVDFSKAQGYVVVPHDKTTAAIYYINLFVDHVKGTPISVTFHNAPDKQPGVRNLVMKKWVNPGG